MKPFRSSQNRENNDNESAGKTLSKINKLIPLAGSIFMFLIIRFSYFYTWVKGYDSYADIFNVLSFFFLLLIVITGVLFIVSLLKKPTAESDPPSRILVIIQITIFVSLIAIHLGLMKMSYNWCFQVISISNIVSKGIDNDGAFFVIHNSNSQSTIKLRCDESTCNLLISDENVLYTIAYRTLTLDERYKKCTLLESIDVQNVIDNRN